MRQWQALGGWIGAHLALLAPVCVATGVLLPQVFGPVNTYAVPFLFACMTFQGSLSNTFQQVADVFRHPWPMLVVILSSQVVLPLLSYALGLLFFPGSPEVVTGILLEYCVPVGVITFMWVGMYEGNTPLALGTILVSTLIAPFTIPLTLQLLMGAVIHVDAVGMMLSMIEMVGAPAVLGMLVNQLSHGWGQRTLSPAIAPAIKLFVLVIITSNSTGMSDYVLHPTAQLVAVAAFVLVFSSLGYLWPVFPGHPGHLPLHGGDVAATDPRGPQRLAHAEAQETRRDLALPRSMTSGQANASPPHTSVTAALATGTCASPPRPRRPRRV